MRADAPLVPNLLPSGAAERLLPPASASSNSVPAREAEFAAAVDDLNDQLIALDDEFKRSGKAKALPVGDELRLD